jgi:hypothetical protein
MNEQWESGHFILSPQNDTLIVIGVAGRHHSRWDNDVSDAEIEAAKDDAARKVAMFYGMSGTVESYHRSGANIFYFISLT